MYLIHPVHHIWLIKMLPSITQNKVTAFRIRSKASQCTLSLMEGGGTLMEGGEGGRRVLRREVWGQVSGRGRGRW